MDTVREIFETNTLGTMAMTQAVLPQFRKRKAGVIVNNVWRGRTPLTLRGLSLGTHTVRVVEKGYAPETRRVPWIAEATAAATREFARFACRFARRCRLDHL